jgi:hypothetical protein
VLWDATPTRVENLVEQDLQHHRVGVLHR